MGYGDEIMASGMARGAAARRKRIAFGDGRKIIWGPWSATIFRGNPNIARQGSEGAADLEWIAHYKGHRLYNRPASHGWAWNYQFKATPGEIFFDHEERMQAASYAPGFVVIEPNVPAQKSVAPNKQWRIERFQAVADDVTELGHVVVQFDHPGARYKLERVHRVVTPGFRAALVALSRAEMFIGPEGGMHHGAAALGIRAVVIFGGFIPPAVTGYARHVNLAAGEPACGKTQACEHCRAALDAISVAQVIDAAKGILSEGRPPVSDGSAARPGGTSAVCGIAAS